MHKILVIQQCWHERKVEIMVQFSTVVVLADKVETCIEWAISIKDISDNKQEKDSCTLTINAELIMPIPLNSN